ncbi:MAG: ATP-dependent helicase [Ilumatobacter sp.]|uniref:ATP-dependent helicase n=1 Tax=Ilumatobacter sp. TaxID=1967498 RepID=UPI00260E51F1|nr:ATP-dependent helicase [Ilumatobacter sp.]MDJ0767137.1 ATP-dependent helicase [Ilumatobacter sp.]
MNRSDLTAKQREAVDARENALLVIGGAGTGKTSLALWAARTELERPENAGSRALFLTFSRTAVDQIATRSKAVVSGIESRIEVSTFHSFAYRILRRFGHLAGVTERNPTVQSASEAKLLGQSVDRLVYDDLMPLALRVLETPAVAGLFAQRWCMVVCDEFQDTGDEHWDLLSMLRVSSRLMLLGDEHQSIFGFLAHKGVQPGRIRDTATLVDRVVELEQVSHRDPTGAIPALASSIRERRFGDESVRDAIAEGRLRIHSGVEDDGVVELIGGTLDGAWQRGCRTFGVFAHSNQSVAELSLQLADANVEHELVGLPDAEADALYAMLASTRYAYREAEWPDVKVALGTFLTASTRGSPPPLAHALASDTPLPSALEERLDGVMASLVNAAEESLAEVAAVAAEAWTSLGVVAGNAPWERSAPSFISLCKRTEGRGERHLDDLAAAIGQMRASAMFDSRRRRSPAVQVMNLHQTKGRESDAVVILFSDSDFHGREVEPFPEASRLLYVVLTRARKEITVILGGDPHPLVAPFGSLT